MDQLIFASLSHTHYWYEVGMLKVPAEVVEQNKEMPSTSKIKFIFAIDNHKLAVIN